MPNQIEAAAESTALLKGSVPCPTCGHRGIQWLDTPRIQEAEGEKKLVLPMRSLACGHAWLLALGQYTGSGAIFEKELFSERVGRIDIRF
jgi:hypothetical protein